MMDLALAMGKTLRQLRDEMSADELALWMARNIQSPVGRERDDFHAAQVSAAVMASQGGKASVSDYMPRWGEASGDGEDTALDALMGGEW